MCMLKSGIALIKNRIYMADHDSHADMLKELNIEDDYLGATKKYVRWVLSPPDGDPFSDIDTWKLKVDQDIRPKWWSEEKYKPQIVEKVKEWAKTHIFVGVDGLKLNTGTNYYIKDCKGAEISGSASVKAWDSAYVTAWDSASVKVYGSTSVTALYSASVEAWDSAFVRVGCSASVKAYGSASVVALGSASVEAWDSAYVKAWDSASVKAYGSAYVRASGSASVEAWDSASVTAWDSASVKASGSASDKASGSASVRASGSAVVFNE